MSTIYLVDFQIRMTFLCWLQQFSIKHLLCSLSKGSPWTFHVPQKKTPKIQLFNHHTLLIFHYAY